MTVFFPRTESSLRTRRNYLFRVMLKTAVLETTHALLRICKSITVPKQSAPATEIHAHKSMR